MPRKLLVAILGFLALVLSPAGCGLFGPSYHYGAGEMRAAVEGTWTLEVDGKTIEFRLTQATHASRATPGLVQTAAACSDGRTFVRSAHACVDEVNTKMPLEVELIAGLTLAKPTTGEFRVSGEHFREGRLSVDLGDLLLDATLAPDGTVTDAHVWRDTQRFAATLARE